MGVSAISSLSPNATTPSNTAFADLGSEDFFKLLIAQLTNQDPFEPTGNEELLQQISSIREIELSTSLTESLSRLTGQQNFGSASALIGQYVTSLSASEGTPISGIVVGVRFDAEGKASLQLAGGAEVPLEEVSTIESPLQVAEKLIGQVVAGIDQRDAANLELIEGLVTAVRVDEQGEIVLELDTGDDLRLRDLISGAAAAA